MISLSRGGTAFGGLFEAVEPALDQRVVGEDELEVDGVHVAQRIDAAVRMRNLGVLESAHDVQQRVHRLQLREVEALRPFALGDARNVDVFDRRRGVLLRVEQVAQRGEARIGDLGDAQVGGVRRQEFSRRLVGRGEGIEQGRLAGFRETEDSELHGVPFVADAGRTAPLEESSEYHPRHTRSALTAAGRADRRRAAMARRTCRRRGRNTGPGREHGSR